MDPNGMNTLLAATPEQLRLLRRRLGPGRAYAFVLRLGRAFSPPQLTAYLRAEGEGFQLRVSEPLAYAGGDAELRDFARRGRRDEATLERVQAFVRRHFQAGEPFEAPAAVGRQAPAHIQARTGPTFREEETMDAPSCPKCGLSDLVVLADAGPTYNSWQCNRCDVNWTKKTLLGKALPFASLGLFALWGLPHWGGPPDCSGGCCT
jgi:hypothetical protein